ncbi:PP2C family protein-serine/threonine phosphatase [Fluviispira multicolorata]|uniref:SpoIIE family protein phosphatase n=1 Tax=Fluviispira multicolorata TaxID=2654512 RepID=A0A833JI38_9BACT|nr:PP2C family protein-serine/threonine phosphatase [Fluviispira multicolorata]KAB8033692.1 SpoIIE family protein phosphatase [Fluviispira multicolorata]
MKLFQIKNDNKNIKFQIISRYVSALLIIACMALVSNNILDRMIVKQEIFSEIINISGRQRMLSQRISLLCYYVYNKKDLKSNLIEKEIVNLATRMKEANIYLAQKEIELGIKKSNEINLYERINNYTNKAIECALTKNCSKFINEFDYNYINNLLKNLNENVERFSDKSKSDIQLILKISRAILLLTLLTLITEVFFIFRPMVKKIIFQINELEQKNRVIFETNKRLEIEMNAVCLAIGNLLPKIDVIRGFDSNLDLAYYYQSAASVGGDLWGIYKLGNKKMILIGDVTGHGAGSAVIASAVSGFIESVSFSQISDMEDLRKVYVDLSNFINKIGDNNFYMTMALIIFDEEMKRFSFINAAHNFPFLVDYTTSEDCIVKRLVLGGYRLGNRIEYKDIEDIKINTYDFNDKTILILFTDGLIENTNDKEIVYGEIRIRKLVKKKNYIDFESSCLMRDIIEDAYSFYNGKLIVDDVTLVVIKKNGVKSNI